MVNGYQYCPHLVYCASKDGRRRSGAGPALVFQCRIGRQLGAALLVALERLMDHGLAVSLRGEVAAATTRMGDLEHVPLIKRRLDNA